MKRIERASPFARIVLAALLLPFSNGASHAQRGSGAGDPASFDGGRKSKDANGSAALSLSDIIKETSSLKNVGKSKNLATLSTQISPEAEIVDRYRQNLLFQLTQRIVWDGCSEQARREAAWIILEMMRYTPVELLDDMVLRHSALIIIPKDKKVTDLPQAARLIGEKRCDGADYSDSRGVANVKMADGTLATFVAEENLLTSGHFADEYVARYTMVHEWAHVVHLSLGNTTEEWVKFGPGDQKNTYPKWEPYSELWNVYSQIREAYFEAQSGKHSYPDSYSKTNFHEFFGQMTAMWFGVLEGDLGHAIEMRLNFRDTRDAEWIRTNNSKLYNALHTIFGPPRKIRPIPDEKF